tara:strand:- start:421 stop:612 length:192 start_codon:yes stop_codon:yes gene_type:complete
MSRPLAKFHWTDDTIIHFQFISSYESKDKVIENITNFVEFDCSLEGNETESDLIKDLTNQIYY